MTSPDRETDSRWPRLSKASFILGPRSRTPAAWNFFNWIHGVGPQRTVSQSCILLLLSTLSLSLFLCVWKFKFSKREHRYDDQGGDGSRCPDDLIPFSSLGSGTNRLCFFVSRFVRLCASVKQEGGRNLCLRNFKGDTVLHCSFVTSLLSSRCNCDLTKSDTAVLAISFVRWQRVNRNESLIRVIKIFRIQMLLEHTLLESFEYYRYISTIYCLLYVSNDIFVTHT